MGSQTKEEFLEIPMKHTKINVKNFFVELCVLLDHALQLLVQMVATWSYSSVSCEMGRRGEKTDPLGPYFCKRKKKVGLENFYVLKLISEGQSWRRGL